MTDFDNAIAIKLPVDGIPAKAIMEIKKITGLSPSEITRKAKADEVLISWDMADLDGLALLNSIKQAMAEQGVQVRLYFGGTEHGTEFFDNLENTYREIGSEGNFDRL